MKSIRWGLASVVVVAVVVALVITLDRVGWSGQTMPTPRKSAQTTTPPPSGPVSTSPTVTGQCQMGWVPTGQGTAFESGQPRDQVIGGTTYYPVVGYQITLTNNGSATADINGWAVAFYDSSGTELGSDEQTITNAFLTSGQSFTWTLYAPTDTDGNNQNFGDDQSIPSTGAASCQLIEWTRP